MNRKHTTLIAMLVALTITNSSLAQPADADFAGGVDDAFGQQRCQDELFCGRVALLVW
jgi:hypothetical protein